MGEMKMEDMPLPALFEQARKIHATATESGADQVRFRFSSSFVFMFLFHNWVVCNLFRSLWKRDVRLWINAKTWLIGLVCSLLMKPKRISAQPISSTSWYLFLCFLITMLFDWLLLALLLWCSSIHNLLDRNLIYLYDDWYIVFSKSSNIRLFGW